MDEYKIITLRCIDCENIECKDSKKYIPIDSLYGCTRKIPESLYEEYYHYMEEIIPFMYTKTTKEYQTSTYKKIIDLLYKIYSCPIGQLLNYSGKTTAQ